MKTFNLNFSTSIKTILFSIFALLTFIQTPAFSEAASVESTFNYNNNWSFIIYERPYFKGHPKSFHKGEYYAGRHCRSEYRGGFSYKVKLSKVLIVL